MISRVLGPMNFQRWGAITASLAFILLLGLWWLADNWYQTGLLAEIQGRDDLAQRSLEIFRLTGLLLVGLITVLVFLVASRQTHLSQTVRNQIEELEQAQQLLEERVMVRTHELKTLLNISYDLTSTLDLKSLLTLIMERTRMVFDYDLAVLFRLTEDNQLEIQLSVGQVAIAAVVGQTTFLLTDLPLCQQAIQERRPLVIDEITTETNLSPIWYEMIGPQAVSYAQTWLTVPLLFQGRPIGILGLGHRQPHYYTPHQADLAMTLGNQAAVAMENARLYQQAQELASLEERRHLARELHDSVSQALYGIALGTRTARMLLDRNPEPEKLAQPLDYIMDLAEAGLSEMRALIFELRPEILEAEGLVVALKKRAEALEARHKLQVLIDLTEEPDVSLASKEMFYRITQEATHNIVKHAKATQIELRFLSESGLILEIKDNGQGFDPQQAFPGHLGLQSMRERAERVGGIFEIASVPGQGTTVQVRLPASTH